MMTKGTWKVFYQMIDGKKQYILGWQKDLNMSPDRRNVELVGLHQKVPDDLQRQADFLNKYGVGKIQDPNNKNERSESHEDY